MAVTVLDYLSPRLVVIAAPDTEITAQELVDELRAWEDRPTSTDDDFIISAAGKEALGGGVTVGITATLQNAQIYFEARSTPRVPLESVSTANTVGQICIATGATFQTDGVVRGDVIYNATTRAMATILSVDSETQITHLPLTGGSRNDWQISDEVVIYNNQQCEVSGGNVVAVDENGNEMAAILQSPNTQVVRTSSSSATLQELQDIQFSSFQGGVWYDADSAFSGTDYPTGTERQPVNNFLDGLSIASQRGFNTFYIRGNATIDSGLDYTDYVFSGQGQNLSDFTITGAANVTNGTFREAKITGTLDGDSHLEDCIIDTVTFISGVIENCILFPSTITLGGNETAHFIDCESGVPGTGAPTIDLGGSGQPLAMRGYNGGVKLVNKTGSESASIDLVSGQVKIDLTTVTGGTIIVRGTGKVVDDATGDWLPSGTYGGLTLINETVHGQMLQDIWRIMGLDPDAPMTVTPTSRTAGDISQVISGDGETTSTVTRQ